MVSKCLILSLLPAALVAQEQSDLRQILDRLERLEHENHELAREVRSLREELAASRAGAATAPPAAATETAPTQPPLEERVAVAEQRIADQAQSKVEASQKFPLTLTGTVLFNAFLNGKASGGSQDPTTASPATSMATGGASFSQTVLGMQFQGPEILGGGHVNGSLYMDLFGGTSSSLNHLLRLRIATLEVDWKSTSILVGQDKPIVAPREPTSFAQVGVSPLTGAGNLWWWGPQARIEQRFRFGENAGVTAQVGVYQTSEPGSRPAQEYASTLSPARPALEGRFEFWRQFGDTRRIEIAPGFHVSNTLVAGTSIPSRLATIDWLIQPAAKLQFTGQFFHGENAAGIGGLRQGFTIFSDDLVTAIGANGGWGQLAILATKRLSFHIYGGEEDDRASNLLTGDIHRNFAYAGNVMYRLGPNLIAALEASQVRTNYFGSALRLNNHYDLALGYLF
jgi:hypothetical protein